MNRRVSLSLHPHTGTLCIGVPQCTWHYRQTIPRTQSLSEAMEGKVAVITGGAGGLGRGFAEILLSHGAKVRFRQSTQKSQIAFKDLVTFCV